MLGVPLFQLVFCWSVIAFLCGVILILETDSAYSARYRLARQLGIPCHMHHCTLPRWHDCPHQFTVQINTRPTVPFRRAA